jgi:hypothetical protein
MQRLLELVAVRCATAVVCTKEEGVKAETVATRPESVKAANFIFGF